MYTLGFTSPGVNPLTGQPLQQGQVLVSGPSITGPRVTVVWSGQPSTWPRWITADAQGRPVDLGTVAGGTWSGPQMLPELVATAIPPWMIAAVILAAALFFGKRKTRGEW